MKIIASLLGVSILLGSLLGSAPASAHARSSLLGTPSESTVGARPSTRPRAAQAPTTFKTSEYTEQNVGGDQVVRFTGDELAAPRGGYYGDTIRPLPGTIRLQLIRPRLNFVPELLKSVENL